jgi:hypothetical protein
MKTTNQFLRVYFFALFFFLSLITNLFAINDLIVRVPDVYDNRPGYIDKAVLVIEPHGCYIEQSLYLEYSDHNQFAGYNKVEIIHRFELPQGSVINDMWLWIGDSVMQARMFDTWTARHIYDSIVTMKRDPAFLSKEGNQYELHIYPLTPGSYRKIKINFITPIDWYGNQAIAELPLKFLNANNASEKPLEILYRYRSDVWGKPELEEIPSASFENLNDTLSYHYKYYKIENTGQYSSLNFKYETKFTGGYYFDSYTRENQPTYFELGILPKELFELKPDSTIQKVFVGLELSGSTNKSLNILIPNLKSTLKNALKPADSFQLIISGAGQVNHLTNDFINADSSVIDTILNIFKESAFADSIQKSILPTLLYCDYDAAICWDFSTINSLASIIRGNDLLSSVSSFNKANIIAAYEHGFESTFDESTFYSSVKPALDTFFIKGGRFLSYFDFNRDFGEQIGKHYINGLRTKQKVHDAVTLYRNNEGNIGKYFPETITHTGTYFLDYNDSDVIVELTDKDGNPAVISKKIKNGLIVISGIWSFNDDNGLKTLLDIPLLGLNSFNKKPQKLFSLLNEIKTEYQKNEFDKVLLFSNADSLIIKNDADNWVSQYLVNYTLKKPVFNTINLIDGTEGLPAYLTDDLINYYGSGYLLYKLSEQTKGLNLETNIDNWNFIKNILSSYSLPKRDSLNIAMSINDGTGQLNEMREVNPIPNDPNKPIFYIGSTSNSYKYSFDLSAKYVDIAESKTNKINVIIPGDTTKMGNIIPTMLGNENLNDLFKYNNQDTSSIVRLALKYNILCDYTALIALEPNDTLHFMQNPYDEGGIITSVINKDADSDSLVFSIYPNPFNSQTTIAVNLKVPSIVNIKIYNILGQEVATLCSSELISDKKLYRWDSRDKYNQFVTSGIYLVCASIKEIVSNKLNVITRKILLVK